MNSKDKFKMFARLGSKALEIIRRNSFAPKRKKELRTWNLTEVSELIGKSTQTIRDHEKKKNIPKAKINKKTGKRFYTLKDINKIREYFNLLPTKSSPLPPVVLSFPNLKGGVAKTTTSVHAAHYFALNGYRTLLVDVDSQASATSAFGYAPDEQIKKEQTLYPFFTGRTKKINSSILKTHWEGLDLIPANLSLYGIELELPALRERALLKRGKDFKIYNILKRGLEQVYDNYDVIIIDCPPSMSISNTNALYASHGVVITCPSELPDVASMVQFFGMIESTLGFLPGKEFNFIRILVTKYDGQTQSEQILDTLKKLYGNHVIKHTMSTTQVIKKARAETNSVYELSKYKGSKQTLNRAINILNNVNTELETLVHETWQTWTKELHLSTKTEETTA